MLDKRTRKSNFTELEPCQSSAALNSVGIEFIGQKKFRPKHRIDSILCMFMIILKTLPIIKGYHVCVTGASGYLGSEVVFQLLEAGQTVRAICRSSQAHLKVWRDNYASRLEIYRDVDLATVPVVCLASLMSGCDFVIHTAAPFPDSCCELDVAGPTLASMENVLAACRRAGVSRAVVTSSAAACRGPRDVPSGGRGVFNEEDWNLSSRPDGPGMEPYQRAKTDAEMAARSAAAEGGPEVVAVLPTCLLGPIRGGPSACAGATSVRMFRRWLGLSPAQGAGTGQRLLVQTRLVCDVRDAAAAHIFAATELSSSIIGPTRFRCASQPEGSLPHRATSRSPPRVTGAPPAGPLRRYLLGHESRTTAGEMRALLVQAATAAGRPELAAGIPPADTWDPPVLPGGMGGKEIDSGRAVRELRGGRAMRPAAETVLEMAGALLVAPPNWDYDAS